MQQDFWYQRWRNGQINFHASEVNPQLQVYWPTLQLAKHSRVLVPLCGKSLDLLWLREQSLQVFGVELVPEALAQFAAEHKLKFRKQPCGELLRWDSDGLVLYQGDIFKLSSRVLGSIDAIYDRAALIAWPEVDRKRYAEHLQQFMSQGTQTLLITLEYPQQQMAGPPFAVPE